MNIHKILVEELSILFYSSEFDCTEDPAARLQLLTFLLSYWIMGITFGFLGFCLIVIGLLLKGFFKMLIFWLFTVWQVLHLLCMDPSFNIIFRNFIINFIQWLFSLRFSDIFQFMKIILQFQFLWC